MLGYRRSPGQSEICHPEKSATYPHRNGGMGFYFYYSVARKILRATQPLCFRVRFVIFMDFAARVARTVMQYVYV